MSKRRLLHVLEATTAGVRRYVTYVLNRRPSDWDVEVACPIVRESHFGDVVFVDDLKQLDVRMHPLPLRRSIGPSDAFAARELLGLIRAERFDLIHTHSSKAGFIGRLIAKASGVPVVHTPNGLYFLEQVGFKRWFYLMLEWLAGRVTSRMVAVSAGERDVIIRHGLVAPERVSLIENGVDAVMVRSQAEAVAATRLRDSLGLNGNGLLVGGVGRMVPQKDPLSFVRAAQQVKQSFPDARFVWCGDGELRPAVEDLARRLDVPLIVTGHLENVWAVMRRFDVFVLPSLYEGLPFTLLEAMALGVPAVATDVVGTRDVLRGEQAGWLVAPGDDTRLAQAIQDVLSQPDEARRRVETAKHLVETRYSVERMIAAHYDLYACTLQTAGRQAR